jgi:hypothetical protein
MHRTKILLLFYYYTDDTNFLDYVLWGNEVIFSREDFSAYIADIIGHSRIHMLSEKMVSKCDSESVCGPVTTVPQVSASHQSDCMHKSAKPFFLHDVFVTFAMKVATMHHLLQPVSLSANITTEETMNGFL